MNLDKARKQAAELPAADSVRGLLELEVQSGVHGLACRGFGATLADPSAAVAILWMRRSFSFAIAVMLRLISDRNVAGAVPPAGDLLHAV